MENVLIMKETEEWIVDWFKKQNNRAWPADEHEVLEKNYFEMGLIDSLGILTLIDAIESEFDIQLSQDHFEQRRFSTIRGLAEIITEEKGS